MHILIMNFSIFYKVISYCQLLNPSWVPTTTAANFNQSNTAFRKLPPIQGDCYFEPELNHKVPINPLGRCFSHDPSILRSNHGRPSSPLIAGGIDNSKLEINEDGCGILSPHVSYHPNLLDDPELWIAGKHSTLLTFPSYMVYFFVKL